jgi:hypothetical protein
MQNPSNWNLEEEGTTSGNKVQHRPNWSNSGTMAAAATVSMPRVAPFPQPPFGFFQLNVPGINYSSNYYSNADLGVTR